MADLRTGLVVQHGATRNLVLPDGEDPSDPQSVCSCVLRGRLRKGPRRRVRPVVIGDRVEFTALEGPERQGAIETILPRHNFISRPQPSGGQHRKLEQVVVANLDRLWVVVSLAQPPLNRRFLDRILAAARHQGVEAGLVLNKVDLEEAGDPSRLAATYESLGYPVFVCSAETGQGLPELVTVLADRIQAFVGLSGVGKSSLMRAIQPGLDLRVASVGERHGHGRHTTSSSRLYWLSEVRGWVADTPGMREFGLWGLFRRELSDGFIEIQEMAPECRFRDCMHMKEPGCAVTGAVEAGEIDAERYASYAALVTELPVDELDRDGHR
jgi:ribosome biogenesis GTPase